MSTVSRDLWEALKDWLRQEDVSLDPTYREVLNKMKELEETF